MIPFPIRDDVKSPAEKRLYEMFNIQLSADWMIFHNIPWQARDIRHGAKDGETDFVLAHPDYGILIFALATVLILAVIAILKNQAIARPDAPEHPFLRIVRALSKIVFVFALIIFGICALIFGLCAVVLVGGAVGAKF